MEILTTKTVEIPFTELYKILEEAIMQQTKQNVMVKQIVMSYAGAKSVLRVEARMESTIEKK